MMQRRPKTLSYPLPQNSGVILIGALMTLFFFIVISVAIAEFGSRQYLSTRRTLINLNALSVSEAGLDRFMYEINTDSNYTGSGVVTLYSDNVKGRATYQTTVTNGSLSNEKIVTSVGKIYLPATSSTALVTRTTKATIIGTASPGYVVQTGPGGVVMTNSSNISGNAYINGFLQMTNTAKIGSSTTPANVYVANANCPAGGGATYPVVCTSGQPISISNQAHIYGVVRATGQTDGSGMSNTGLVAGSTAPTVALPSDDRTSQTSAVAQTITGASASCSGSQTKTLQANTKITGSFSASNSCVVTVLGDVWITGNFNLSNSVVFKVGPGVTQSPRIMVDGSGGVDISNSASVASNASNIGFTFVTYHSAASCSPDCADVTGIDLYNSRNLETINLSNSALAAGSTFYARWSKVNLANGGTIGGVMGQTIELSNTSAITFGSGSSGGGNTVWDIRYYTQAF